jgi:hypothetical protein
MVAARRTYDIRVLHRARPRCDGALSNSLLDLPTKTTYASC